jgi:hypothetical protein
MLYYLFVRSARMIQSRILIKVRTSSRSVCIRLVEFGLADDLDLQGMLTNITRYIHIQIFFGCHRPAINLVHVKVSISRASFCHISFSISHNEKPIG